MTKWKAEAPSSLQMEIVTKANGRTTAHMDKVPFVWLTTLIIKETGTAINSKVLECNYGKTTKNTAVIGVKGGNVEQES
jgi:hypothetical protein